ncbi:MAG: hypothetical protein E7614_00290 [Ruminococcaceae bacterium]|nr:hypothetical protein [Oscillospiraceae bacterium]
MAEDILPVWRCTKQMNRRILSIVLEEYAEKRVSARSEAERKKKKLYNDIPALEKIDIDISSCGFKLMKASLDESEDYDSALERIKAETIELREKRKKLLAENNLPENVCEPVYSCKNCNDTGYKDGKMCDCLRKAVAILSYKESGLGTALTAQTFDNFNLSYYLAGNDSEVFERMTNLYADAKAYANNFCGKGNLLMIGGTGLGKTHLSTSIAKTVIEKGYTVVYESAQKIFDIFEDKKFGRTPDADTEKFGNADLLIVDDLGTEHITQFTVSVLYNLINERCNNSKAMIISTNLTPEELKNTYKPRIFSRLLGEFKFMPFHGKDIRLQKLGE